MSKISREPILTLNARKAQRGDEAAFEKLIEATQDRLFRFCVFLCGTEAAAQDLCQETYLKAYRHLRQLEDPAHVRGWLFKIARNVYRDDLRRPVPLAVAYPDTSRRSAGDDGEAFAAVRESLEQLPADERAALLLVDLEGYSYAEAAEILGVSEAALKSRLHRSRTRFVAKVQGG